MRLNGSADTIAGLLQSIDWEGVRYNGRLHERVLKNTGGDAFNASANPLTVTLDDDRLGDRGVDDLDECTSSFRPDQSYFNVCLKRCQTCGGIWLLGYYEDFDAVPIEAEWGVRTWIWRPLTPQQVAEIEAASGSAKLDLDTFAARP